jgi:hypothetical protein
MANLQPIFFARRKRLQQQKSPGRKALSFRGIFFYVQPAGTECVQRQA